jgi:hypothetical protein
MLLVYCSPRQGERFAGTFPNTEHYKRISGAVEFQKRIADAILAA